MVQVRNSILEKWDMQEISCKGHTEGNPFTDYDIKGTFSHPQESLTVDGFYDGNGIYKVRFMPSFTGTYTYRIFGSFSTQAYEGTFQVTEATGENHGPVRVCNTYHFAYEDGTPHYSLGTTCYVWELQDEKLQEKTLETLKNSAFNKIRFCIFPKHYDYNLHEPISYPYEGMPVDSSLLTKDNFMEYMGKSEGNEWDFTRFHVGHFQHIDSCIEKLRDMGIEADLIMMHPYDRWGFSQMKPEDDELYWKYILARFSAYRNVWWSLANEYDLLAKKSIKDWERMAKTICEKDPYHHLRSIHHCRTMYDHTRPWITHCSIQRTDVYKCAELVDQYRIQYRKPVVLDEIAYEGNIQHGWGNISGKELVRRFWEAACRGGYAGHGETYMHPQDILWWSHGGELHGESPERLAFLLKILKETPGYGLRYKTDAAWDEVAAVPDSPFLQNDYMLIYYGFNRPSFRDYYLNDVTEYEVEVIDTWEMTIEKIGTFKGKFRVPLPGKEYMAVRIRKI